MRAIVVRDSDLVVSDVAEPDLRPGEVMIDVYATALNRADLSQAAGHYPPPAGESEILGLEAAGVVTAVGDGTVKSDRAVLSFWDEERELAASFRSAVESGVVFALANLNMDINDVQATTATMLADSGDFLAVPDPRSYAVLPRYPRTARVNSWMRATDGQPWQGCPRTRLQGIVDELKAEGFSTCVALEPEFYLLRRGEDGGYAPVNNSRMFTEAG